MAHDAEGGLITAGGLPPYTEFTRRGDLWSVQTATPFTPLVVVPTTLTGLEVVNNHATKSMVIDSIWTWQLLGTAVVWQMTPWAQVGAKVYSGNTALVIHSGNGNPSYTSAVGSEASTAINQSVIATGWRVFPGSTTSWGLAAATPGGATVGQVDGRLVVPPNKAVHVTATASVATASSTHVGVSWFLADVENQ